MRRLVTTLLGLLVAGALYAQTTHPPTMSSSSLPTCNVTRDGTLVSLVDASNTIDCNTTGGGSITATCKCEQQSAGVFAWVGVSTGAHTVDTDTDNQTAPEVPYTPNDVTDWITDPDDAAEAIHELADRLNVNGTGDLVMRVESVDSTELGSVAGTVVDVQKVTFGDTVTAPTFAGALTGNATTATTATTANAGDSATSFFSTGTLEDARLSTNVSLLGQTISASEVAADVATQAEVDALNLAADDLSDDGLGSLGNVDETGEGDGIPLVGDGVGGWQPAASQACLEDGTNCPAAGASPAGSGSELQFRLDGTTFGAVTGSSTANGGVALVSQSAAAIPFQVKGAASQSADLFLLENSAGTDLVNIEADGDVILSRLRGRIDNPFTRIEMVTAKTMSFSVWNATALNLFNNGSAIRYAAIGFTQVNTPTAATCTDTGTGAAGALTIQPAFGATLYFITNADPDGCALTLGETNMTSLDGALLEVVVVSTAGGTVDIADTAGVVNTPAGGLSLGLDDTATFRYVTDRYVTTSRSDN